MITYGMAAASMTGEKCSKNFFRTCGNTDQQSYALAELVAKKGYKKVAIIAQDYSFGKEALGGIQKEARPGQPLGEDCGRSSTIRPEPRITPLT